jgi:hypothetical protein
VRELKADSKPKEHAEKGQVKRAVYAEYIKAASRIGVTAFLLCVALSQATSIREYILTINPEAMLTGYCFNSIVGNVVLR